MKLLRIFFCWLYHGSLACLLSSFQLCDPLIVRFTLAVLPRWWALVLPCPPCTWAPPAHPIHRAAHRSHGAGYEWWGIQSLALPSRPKGRSLGHVAGIASKLRGCRVHDCASVSISFNKFIHIKNKATFWETYAELQVTYLELQARKFWKNTCNLICKLSTTWPSQLSTTHISLSLDLDLLPSRSLRYFKCWPETSLLFLIPISHNHHNPSSRSWDDPDYSDHRCKHHVQKNM